MRATDPIIHLTTLKSEIDIESSSFSSFSAALQARASAERAIAKILRKEASLKYREDDILVSVVIADMQREADIHDGFGGRITDELLSG
jgi:hypothetical protein